MEFALGFNLGFNLGFSVEFSSGFIWGFSLYSSGQEPDNLAGARKARQKFEFCVSGPRLPELACVGLTK